MSISVRFLGPSPLYTASLTFYSSSQASTPVVKVIVVRHLVIFIYERRVLQLQEQEDSFPVLLGCCKHDSCLGWYISR